MKHAKKISVFKKSKVIRVKGRISLKAINLLTNQGYLVLIKGGDVK